MDMNEIAQAISAKTGVDVQSTQKVLVAAFAVLGEQLTKEEKVKLEGLGTFLRKAGKEPGKSRTLFKAWSEKGDKKGKKAGAAGKEPLGPKERAEKRAKRKERKRSKESASK